MLGIFRLIMKSPRVSSKHILLVEDDPGALESIKLLLHIDRHIVTEANNGREALDRLAEQRFDLVILDYFMPGMRGDELAVALKAIAPGLPILMITAYLEKLGDADKPVDAVLAKPFAVDELRQTVAKLLGAIC